jgi:hypothetical protein
LAPILITAALYFGVFEYEKNNSRDGWGGFGPFVIAPYFFVAVGILNLWILALRGRHKGVVFSFGLILPLTAFGLLFVL